MPKLPHEESGQPQAHSPGEIRKGDGIAVNENTRAKQMKKLIDPIAMRYMMIVFFTPDHLGIEAR